MRNKQEDSKLIASLAVFRELYDSEKDVYGVIAIFLKDIIKNNALYSFTIGEITSQLNSIYEFEIPSAVVNTALGRLDFLTKELGVYTISEFDKLKETQIDEKTTLVSNNNEDIIKNLFTYIENEKEITLDDVEKNIITHSFSSFLLDENNGNEYLEYITSYILKNESDLNFKYSLNLIREGVILYSGIKYNNNLNDIGTWRTELTIYLDTEVLFHLAGYNGELYQTLIRQLFSYVTEINQKAGRRLIQLKYFYETKIEIEGFFTKAKYLIEGAIPPNPQGAAMVTIINGCSKPSDIIEKKSDFYNLLKIFFIEEDSYTEYFSPQNHDYNIISQDIIDSVSAEIGKDANEYLTPLNFISIHRKEANDKNFENIKAILLTGNSVTLKVAWNNALKNPGQVPLATTISFLTSKFWFKLNKGFGKDTSPVSFDITTKAQIILSKALSDSVGEKFTELNQQFKDGNLTEEQVKARIWNLRKQAHKPEEIKNEIVSEVIHTITEDSLQKFIDEQDYFKNQAKEKDNENLELKKQIILDKQEKEKQILSSKKEFLIEKNKSYQLLLGQKKPLDETAVKAYKNFKITIGAIIILYSAIVILAIVNYGWDKMESVTYVLFAVFPFVIMSIYSLITEKTINPLEFLKRRRELFYVETYEKFNFNLESLTSFEQELEKLKQEIKSLEKPADNGV